MSFTVIQGSFVFVSIKEIKIQSLNENIKK